MFIVAIANSPQGVSEVSCGDLAAALMLASMAEHCQRQFKVCIRTGPVTQASLSVAGYEYWLPPGQAFS